MQTLQRREDSERLLLKNGPPKLGSMKPSGEKGKRAVALFIGKKEKIDVGHLGRYSRPTFVAGVSVDSKTLPVVAMSKGDLV